MAEITETNGTDRMTCGHPRGCIVQDAESAPRCAWCEEVARLREELEQAAAREAVLVVAANALVQRLAAINLQKSKAIALGNALAYGPEIAALQDVLENIAQPASALLEQLKQTEAEVARLRMVLSQDGAAYLPCQHCGKDVATPTLESVELCFGCWERLRALIPNADLLRRLADYASYDFTNQSPSFEDMRQKLHADAVAARELADRIEEANIDKE